jgi:transposase
MESTILFEMALGLSGGWKVVKSEFAGEPRKLEIYLDFAPGQRFGCPECGELCVIHDTAEKRWRHLNFFQYPCELVARVPRAICAKHGVRQVEVPWARAGSGFTVMMEAAVLLLAREMPVSAVAEMLGEVDTRLWRLIVARVAEAHAQSDWSGVKAIAIDETSVRKGWQYVTVILDADTRRLLYLAPGRSGQALVEFRAALLARGGRPEQIGVVVMDMLHCYKRGVRENFPWAKVVYDRFHVMVMAGEAVEKVRKTLQAQGAPLKGSLWALRGNLWNLSASQQAVREDLSRRYKELGRALALRSALQDVYASGNGDDGPEMLAWWCQWAKRSRLAPFAKLADTIKENWAGITAYFTKHYTQGPIEAVNGIIQLAKRRARGFRNLDYLRAIAYWISGKLTLNLPSLLPT